MNKHFVFCRCKLFPELSLSPYQFKIDCLSLSLFLFFFNGPTLSPYQFKIDCLSLFLFFLTAPPSACRGSWARDGVWAPAVTYTTAVSRPDPLTHCARLGVDPPLHSDLSWIFHSLCHGGNSRIYCLSYLYFSCVVFLCFGKSLT